MGKMIQEVSCWDKPYFKLVKTCSEALPLSLLRVIASGFLLIVVRALVLPVPDSPMISILGFSIPFSLYLDRRMLKSCGITGSRTSSLSFAYL